MKTSNYYVMASNAKAEVSLLILSSQLLDKTAL